MPQLSILSCLSAFSLIDAHVSAMQFNLLPSLLLVLHSREMGEKKADGVNLWSRSQSMANRTLSAIRTCLHGMEHKIETHCTCSCLRVNNLWLGIVIGIKFHTKICANLIMGGWIECWGRNLLVSEDHRTDFSISFPHSTEHIYSIVTVFLQFASQASSRQIFTYTKHARFKWNHDHGHGCHSMRCTRFIIYKPSLNLAQTQSEAFPEQTSLQMTIA